MDCYYNCRSIRFPSRYSIFLSIMDGMRSLFWHLTLNWSKTDLMNANSKSPQIFVKDNFFFVFVVRFIILFLCPIQTLRLHSIHIENSAWLFSYSNCKWFSTTHHVEPWYKTRTKKNFKYSNSCEIQFGVLCWHKIYQKWTKMREIAIIAFLCYFFCVCKFWSCGKKYFALCMKYFK